MSWSYINKFKLEIAITTQTPPHVSCEYKLKSVVHKFIVGKLVFMAMNALYIRFKIPYKVIPKFSLYML